MKELRRLLKEKKLTLYKLALRMGLHNQALYKPTQLGNHDSNTIPSSMSVGRLREIAAAAGMNVNSFDLSEDVK